jgi:linoleoyl-CoA desaturase
MRRDGLSGNAPITVVKYGPRTDFHRDLRAAVDRFLERHGEKRTGGWPMARKCAIIAIWLLASYLFVVFYAQTWWQAALGLASFSLAFVGVGFGIQHDANHGSLVESKRLGRLAGASLDLLGASSYFWRTKHNVLHHQYPNVDGLDDDIDPGFYLRLAPTQRRYWFHRYQAYYAWVLYGLLVLEWAFFGDYRKFLRRKIGEYPVTRPRGWELALLIGGKLTSIGWLLVIPSLFHPVHQVLLAFVAVMFFSGMLLAVVFQLAHCVDTTRRYGLADPSRPDHGWARHQLATTCDFAPRNRIVTWYLGGLNFQVIHHLFPRISHRLYPRLAPIVDAVCREHGVTYHVKPSLRAALRSHAAFLREMGAPLVVGPA